MRIFVKGARSCQDGANHKIMMMAVEVMCLALVTPIKQLATPFGIKHSASLVYEEVASGLNGVRTLAPIERGDNLVTVPLSACLHTPRQRNDDVELARLLLAATAHDPWREYRDVVLPACTDAAMLWPAEEAEELQWPPACALARSLRGRIESTAATEWSLDEWSWAMGIVYSRSFSIEASDDDGGADGLRCLAPVLDLFNHRPESPVEYAARWAEQEDDDEPPASPWALSGDFVQLVADEPVGAGEEVCIPYGLETGLETLVQSGFRPLPNSADFVALFSDVDELSRHLGDAFGLEATQRERRLAMLRALDASDAPLAVRPGPLAASAHLLACSRPFAATDDELSDGLVRFVEDYEPAAGHYTLRAVVGAPARAAALERDVCAVLGQLAEACLDALPTTHEEDETLLSQPAAEMEAQQRERESAREPASPSPARFEAAVRFRRDAKRLLAHFCSACARVATDVS